MWMKGSVKTETIVQDKGCRSVQTWSSGWFCRQTFPTPPLLNVWAFFFRSTLQVEVRLGAKLLQQWTTSLSLWGLTNNFRVNKVNGLTQTARETIFSNNRQIIFTRARLATREALSKGSEQVRKIDLGTFLHRNEMKQIKVTTWHQTRWIVISSESRFVAKRLLFPIATGILSTGSRSCVPLHEKGSQWQC